MVLIIVPSTGTNKRAINNEDVSTHINVIGRYFINSPANPGQKEVEQRLLALLL